MADINDTLKERGNNYGEFTDHAKIAQRLKEYMRLTPGWSRLEDDQRECLEMVAHKIARILNGNVNYRDSWWDCIGYLQLVINRMDNEK